MEKNDLLPFVVIVFGEAAMGILKFFIVFELWHLFF